VWRIRGGRRSSRLWGLLVGKRASRRYVDDERGGWRGEV
jgi:hypothetical protein